MAVKLIKESTPSYREFIIMDECYEETDKAVGVNLQRDDGVIVKGRRGFSTWFPKSQCPISQTNSGIKIKIPEWLYKKSIPRGWTIFTG